MGSLNEKGADQGTREVLWLLIGWVEPSVPERSCRPCFSGSPLVQRTLKGPPPTAVETLVPWNGRRVDHTFTVVTIRYTWDSVPDELIVFYRCFIVYSVLVVSINPPCLSISPLGISTCPRRVMSHLHSDHHD